MKDEDKTREQLIRELLELRQQVAEVEALKTYCKQAEEAQRKTEERYRSLFDDLPVGVYQTTPDGWFLEANSAFLEIFGYPDFASLTMVKGADLYVDPEERKLWQERMTREEVVRD